MKNNETRHNPSATLSDEENGRRASGKNGSIQTRPKAVTTMRDRLNHYEAEKTQHLDWRRSRERLSGLIDSGDKVTQRDIADYAVLKRQYQATEGAGA